MRSPHAVRGVTLVGLLLIALAVSAPPANAAGVLYRASISGVQELTWSVDGTRGSCEIRRGTGNGSVKFRFRSPKPGPASALPGRGGLRFSLGLPATATGTIAGTFTDANATPCPGFDPAEPVTRPVDGCGATKFGLRVDAQVRGAFVYVTGPTVPLGPPASINQAGGSCPFPLGGPIDSSSDRSACGDGNKLWQRSWGVSYSEGRGLAASRIAIKPGTLLRPKRRTVLLTGRSRVDCTIESTYSGGVKLTLDLRYTITLRRVR